MRVRRRSSFVVRRASLLAAAVLLSLCGVQPAVRADVQPLRVALADDTVLATMVLVGFGQTGPVLLFDAHDPAAFARAAAAFARPVECFVRAAGPAPARAALEAATGVACTAIDDLVGFAHRLWPHAGTAVAAPAADYPWLLRGAAFAAATGAALLPLDAGKPLGRDALADWPLLAIFSLPGTADLVPTEPGGATIDSPEALLTEWLRPRDGRHPDMVVVANPRDRAGVFSPSALSMLAPLISARHRAPLLLVSDSAPDRIEAEVRQFIAAHDVHPTDIYLVGDELALRSHRVPDPVLEAGGPEALGGARDVRVELFSQIQTGAPQDYAVGRFVAADLAQGSALLARQLHGAPAGRGRVALLSNADRVFALGETISRTTVSELRNAGATVDAHYREAVTPAVIARALEQADVLVWEGHARDLTLEERGGIAVERVPPVVVLQGCYTLDRSDPFILIERGTQAIVATSAAIYSASGSAFARALFDALLYDGADLGTAVRDARNYLLALTELKKRRGHPDWTKTYRAALAFALWGDPTARPALAAQPPKRPPAKWELRDDHLLLTIPTQRLKTATVGRYVSAPVPGAMLSGLILRDGDRPERELKELFFATVSAPPGVGAACPLVPGWEVVSLYAPHTHTLSVLARPKNRMGGPRPTGDFVLPLVSDAARCQDPPCDPLSSQGLCLKTGRRLPVPLPPGEAR